MDKRGKTGFWLPFMGILGLAVVVMLGVALFRPGTFASTEPVSPEATMQKSIDLNAGKAATLKVRAYNRTGDSQPQAAPAAYLIETIGGNERLIADGTTLSATADTSVATTVGAHIYGVAFSSVWYGVPKEIDVSKEVEPFYLDVLENAATTAGNVNITTWKDSSNANGNVTLGASQTDTWDKIRIKVNADQRAFNFKGIVFNMTSASNIDRVTVNGLELTTAPRRLSLTSSAEYFFAVPEAKLLRAWDVFDTGVVAFKATSTNPSEGFDLLIVDEAYYRSVDRTHIKKGVEDDQPTVADVGLADIRYTGFVI